MRFIGRFLCAIGLHRESWATHTPGILAGARERDANLQEQVTAAYFDTLLSEQRCVCTRCHRRLW